MNITRHTWSDLDCLKFNSNIGFPIIITAVIVGIIPVLFYLLSKNVSILEDVKLVRREYYLLLLLLILTQIQLSELILT